MTIRVADPRDAAPLAAFLRRTFVDAYGHVADAANLARFLDGHYAPPLQAAELADPVVTTWIDDAGGAWRGVVQLHRAARAPLALPREPAALVQRLYVDAPHHGRGVAAELMDTLEAAARSEGLPALWLSAHQHAPRALRFYAKRGWRNVGTTTFDVGAVRTDDFVLFRPL